MAEKVSRETSGIQPELPAMPIQREAKVLGVQPVLSIIAGGGLDVETVNKTPSGKIRKYRKLPRGEKREKGSGTKRNYGDPDWWQKI